jgi:hypothetical protein
MEKIRVCICGVLFTPEGRGQIRCKNCQSGPRRARPYLCDIVEVRSSMGDGWEELDSPFYGRCSGYMHGICEKCLDYCAEHYWRGWKADGCEWWSGVKTIPRGEKL